MFSPFKTDPPNPAEVKKKSALLLLATCGLLLISAGSGYVGWFAGIHSQVISRETATSLALARIGEGTPRNARLSHSRGMPVWELNIERPNEPGVIEVCVHALTGEIVAVHRESLRKANRELSAVARRLGITAEHLPAKAGDKLASTPPAETTAFPAEASPERSGSPATAPSATVSNQPDNPEK